MKYIDMINQIEGFKYSSNIKYDLLKENKIAQYIPTKNALDIFEEIFRSITIESNNRKASRLIYGSYGTGKSSFLTTLASILGKVYSTEIYSIFLDKVEKINFELQSELKDYLSNSEPYLVVTIDGSFGDFNHCIYYSLINTLEKNKINYKLEDPYIEAIEIISKWDINKNNDFRKLLHISLEMADTNLPDLVSDLKMFDKNALNKFRVMFKYITSGVNYRHVFSSISDNLDLINKAVLKKGYKGIIFIFDEFGKYLEDNIKNIDIKPIQDIAEYCDHSEYDNHIILVSHKEFSQYSKTEGIEQWKKIESRYKSIEFNQSDEEIYFLIKSVISKEDFQWEKFKNKNNKEFNKIVEQVSKDPYFNKFEKKELIENIVYGIYPLHPITARMLIMLSKKIAQNERTIFTFLAGDEENSLGEFIRESNIDNFRFISADIIYDYFENNLPKDRSSFEFQEWVKIKNALNKISSSDNYYSIKSKIIKSAGIINIINDYDRIRPDKETLISIIDEDESDISNALKEMSANKIFLYIRQYKYYTFFDASSLDIEKLIEDTIENINNTSPIIEYLNRNFIKIPILPNAYNHEFKMMRYYHPIFIMDDEIDKLDKLINNNYFDGIMAFVLTDKDIDQIKPIMQGKRTLFIYRQNTTRLIYEVKKLLAIEYILLEQESIEEKDPKAVLELNAYKEEIVVLINNTILEWYDSSDKNNIYVQDGKMLEEVKTVNSLSNHMSTEMWKYFDKTLIVNNELINKNKISTTMIRARKEIIEDILFNSNKELFLEYKDLSTNHTFVRSLLNKNDILNINNIDKDEKDIKDRRLTNSNHVMNEINKFIDKAKVKPMCLKEIIHTLKAEPYGLRDGYITVLLVIGLINYKGSIYIRLADKDQKLNGELFDRILKLPDQFTLIIDKWEEDKEYYILEIEKIFNQFIDEDLNKMNRLKALHEGLLNHYRSMSKFSRTTKLVTEETIKYVTMLEKDISDYREFFFNSLASLGKDFNDAIINIRAIKSELESATDKLILDLINRVNETFNINGKQNLIKSFKYLIDTKWENRMNKSLDYQTNRFVEIIESSDEEMNDSELIKRIALQLTGFQINYWSDNQIKEFQEILEDIKSDLECNNSESIIENDNVVLAIEDKSGRIKKVGILNEELSANSQILKNILQANIDNFGQALSFETKRQVICEILMKYI